MQHLTRYRMDCLVHGLTTGRIKENGATLVLMEVCIMLHISNTSNLYHQSDMTARMVCVYIVRQWAILYCGNIRIQRNRSTHMDGLVFHINS